MVGVIIAMERELEPYIRNGIWERSEYKGKIFYTGEIENEKCVICFAGVGKVNAAYSATLVIERFSPEFIINTGTSGGLTVLKSKDIVIAEKTVQHDFDTTALGDPLGFVGSPVSMVYFPTDKKLSDIFRKALPEAHYGVVACGDSFIAGRDKAEFIVNNFNAIACDMESAAISQVCHMAKVPCVIIRGVSDTAEENTFFELLGEVSEKTYLAVAKALARGRELR